MSNSGTMLGIEHPQKTNPNQQDIILHDKDKNFEDHTSQDSPAKSPLTRQQIIATLKTELAALQQDNCIIKL